MTIWVSLEGIEGVGKTHLAGQLRDRLPGRCLLVAELTNQSEPSLPSRLITALSSAGDPFLRTGHPLTETLTLIALKVRERELLGRDPATQPEMVLEDRGIDTVAVYQSIILTGTTAPVERLRPIMELIYATAAPWCPLPDLTLLLTDDVDTCIGRFQARLGQAVRRADRALIARASELYADLARSDPCRFAVIDRAGRTEADTLAAMHAACAERLGT